MVEVRDGWPTLPDARRTFLFENPKGRARVYREGFLEVAAAGMLASQFGWPPERLTFQSPKAEQGSRLWAFDLLAYADDRGTERVAIAGEVKWKQSDAIKLRGGLGACGARGSHSEDDCGVSRNHHRKYQGLLEHRPRVLWIIGPDAFSGAPDLVFRVDVKAGGGVDLEPVEAVQLAASSAFVG